MIRYFKIHDGSLYKFEGSIGARYIKNRWVYTRFPLDLMNKDDEITKEEVFLEML